MTPDTFELQHTERPDQMLLDEEITTPNWPMPVGAIEMRPRALSLAERVRMALQRWVDRRFR